MENIKKTEINQPVKIEVTLPTHAYFLSGIRDFTLNLIRNTTDFSEQWAYRFQSIIDELCSNAIEYGAKAGDNIKVTFLYKPHESIEFSVEDPGTGNKHRTAEELTKLVEEKSNKDFQLNEIRGRGLSKIVKEWTDELVFTDNPNGGIIVKVKKFLTDKKTAELLPGLSLAGDQTHIVI